MDFATPDAKISDITAFEIMAPNHAFKYPKCVQSQKGEYLFISDAFGVHYNSDI